ncbi:NACHT domain containing protein [Acanthamoeba castellanii str. Neff]|uniref:NACHT domain containing protein n=1 Tax=Acanthamoeba castellanii (strain ATCC 30010 / Neff) TaxID=1257118 RepID=L8GUT6_ACACF|nr:NACHT domain containing protein [Acanthamoeba castellanii str. Neff]ELR16687.1 NACHT domain containing protein [Acanthamoeba castellanii str. Neff]
MCDGGEKEDDEAVEKEEGVAEDYTALKQGFLKLLEKAAAAVAGSHKTAQRRLVLIIDALNQLDESYNAHSLDWLPRELPKGLRVVVSTLRGSCLDSINRRPNVQITVGPLDLDERKEIVRKTLWEYRKKLDDRQMKRLLSKKDAYKPLYLIVACEELRVFGVYELVSERIDSMADTVPALFEEVLMRLEKDHGWDLVRNALALLQCSRGGLLESECIDWGRW